MSKLGNQRLVSPRQGSEDPSLKNGPQKTVTEKSFLDQLMFMVTQHTWYSL